MSQFNLEAVTENINSEKGLEHAVFQSLLNFGKAQANDPLEKGANKQGWWASEYTKETGCRDWTLAREKQTEETLTRAKIHTEKALEWLLNDKIVKKIIVTTHYQDERLIRIINITKQSNQRQQIII